MKKKKAELVVVTQTSESSNASTKFEALIHYYEQDQSSVSFMYKENEDYRVHLTFDESQLACMRVGEDNTFCWFSLGKFTPLLKDSEIGPILLQTHTTTYEYEQDKIRLVYDLWMDNDKVDTIEMTWEIIRK